MDTSRSAGAHLRPLQQADAPRMLEWMQSGETTRYLAIGGPATAMADVLAFLESARRDERQNVHRAIVAGDDTYLGTVSLKHIDRNLREAEYAIALHPDAMGTGAARAATEQILHLAFFELGLARVYLNVLEENRRAIRFYEKFGFTFTHCTDAQVKGQPHRLRWYQLAAPAARPPAAANEGEGSLHGN